jgi:hypothetical protein
MSPMSTAGMNAVDTTKAGVASGVLSMSRMVGGTLGVAVMGALITAIGRARVDTRLPHLPAGRREALVEALGAGGVGPGSHAGVPAHVIQVLEQAYVAALGTGMRVCAAALVAGALVAWALIAKRSDAPEGTAMTAPGAAA